MAGFKVDDECDDDTFKAELQRVLSTHKKYLKKEYIKVLEQLYAGSFVEYYDPDRSYLIFGVQNGRGRYGKGCRQRIHNRRSRRTYKYFYCWKKRQDKTYHTHAELFSQNKEKQDKKAAYCQFPYA